MGRPVTQRQPVRRAILDVLGSDPVLARDALAQVRQRTGASRQTIERHGRDLYLLDRIRAPGARTPIVWWQLRPEVMTTDAEILITAPENASEPAVMTSGKRSRRSSKRGRSTAQQTTHAGSRASMRTRPPSLLDDGQRSEGIGSESPREAVISWFAACLESRRLPLHTLNLTTAIGSDAAALSPLVAEHVAAWNGGIWIVPQSAGGTDDVHFHGLVMGVDPQAVITRWIELADGSASRDSQRTARVSDLKGWLNYCRRQPGFSLESVIAAGRLESPWSWALGRGHQPLPRLAWADAASTPAQPSPAELADLRALQRVAPWRPLARLPPRPPP